MLVRNTLNECYYVGITQHEVDLKEPSRCRFNHRRTVQCLITEYCAAPLIYVQ